MGQGITRAGKDKAGGTIIASQEFCFCESKAIALKGDSIVPHAPCSPFSPLHCFATISQGSNYVYVDGTAVCRQGDSATCGHTAEGSSKIFAM